MTSKQQCCVEVWGEWRSHQCSRAGKIERDGKFYCGQHDPVAIKEKDEEKRRQREAESKARARQAELQSLRYQVCAGLTAADLRRVLDLGGVKALLPAPQEAEDGR